MRRGDDETMMMMMMIVMMMMMMMMMMIIVTLHVGWTHTCDYISYLYIHADHTMMLV